MQFRHRRQHGKRIAMTNQEAAFLIDLCEGEKALIMQTQGGHGVIRRLAEMGLTPGAEIRILRKCPFHGPIELKVRGVELALGYGVASKVLVRPLKAEANG